MGSLAIRVRDELGPLFADEEFGDLLRAALGEREDRPVHPLGQLAPAQDHAATMWDGYKVLLTETCGAETPD
ncbi:hypothetical protein [Streptomyces sp. NPDC055085]